MFFSDKSLHGKSSDEPMKNTDRLQIEQQDRVLDEIYMEYQQRLKHPTYLTKRKPKSSKGSKRPTRPFSKLTMPF